MARYLMRVLSPFGQEIFASHVEMEDFDGIDDLTGLMTTPDGVTQAQGRFAIKGGFSPQAAYSVEFTRQ